MISQERSAILRNAAETGEIWMLTYNGGPIWIRAGKVDLGSEQDRGEQALYVDELREMMRESLVEHRGGDYYRLTGAGFTAAKRAVIELNIKDEAAMRGRVLRFLYDNKNHSWAYAKPESFSPPMMKRQIFLIGKEFHEAGIIKEFPSDNGDGYYMRITTHGQAVWAGKETTSLDIQIPKNSSTPSPITAPFLPVQSQNLKPQVEPIPPKDEKVPSTFEEGLVSWIWKSRFKWFIIIPVALAIAVFAVYIAQPDEVKIRILKYLGIYAPHPK